MGEPSFFFTDPPCGMTSVSELECIYQSESGPSMLFRTAREGKFRVLKALKEEHRRLAGNLTIPVSARPSISGKWKA